MKSIRRAKYNKLEHISLIRESCVYINIKLQDDYFVIFLWLGRKEVRILKNLSPFSRTKNCNSNLLLPRCATSQLVNTNHHTCFFGTKVLLSRGRPMFSWVWLSVYPLSGISKYCLHHCKEILADHGVPAFSQAFHYFLWNAKFLFRFIGYILIGHQLIMQSRLVYSVRQGLSKPQLVHQHLK